MLGGDLTTSGIPFRLLAVFPVQEAVISSPWMVPQNHLSFSKASTSKPNPAAGTLPAFYLLPERASKNTSKINMFLSVNWSQDDDKTLNQQVSHRFQSNTLNRRAEKASWKLHQRPGFLPEAPGEATMAQWMALGPLSGLPTPQPWISCSSVLDLQREMIFHWHSM